MVVGYDPESMEILVLMMGAVSYGTGFVASASMGTLGRTVSDVIAFFASVSMGTLGLLLISIVD